MDSSKSNGIEASNWARAPVQSGALWQRCLRVIYNPEEKSFFGRTAKRWGIVLIFYAVFYAVLAAMFAACMGGLLLTLDDNKPKYTLDDSLLGSSPGLAARPLPLEISEKRPTVTYDKSDNSSNNYTKQLDEFFNSYESGNKNPKECLVSDKYGFPDNPCFYIKVNKLYDWKPDCYEKGSLPSNMPEDLRQSIDEDNPSELKIWISCEESRDHLRRGEDQPPTNITYPWGRGLPTSPYPYRKQEGFRSPVLAIKLFPPVNKDVVVRCRAWAKNIVYDGSWERTAARGYTVIRLRVNDNTQ